MLHQLFLAVEFNKTEGAHVLWIRQHNIVADDFILHTQDVQYLINSGAVPITIASATFTSSKVSQQLTRWAGMHFQ